MLAPIGVSISQDQFYGKRGSKTLFMSRSSSTAMLVVLIGAMTANGGPNLALQPFYFNQV
jgi:hypothetical protein